MSWNPKRVKLIKISKFAVLILLIILIIFAGFTIYGKQVGNFIIKTDSGKEYMSLSVFEDHSEPRTYLQAEGMDGLYDGTLSYIPTNITDGMGNKNDKRNAGQYPRYMAYSFYLINTANFSYDYNFTITITQVKKNLDECIRVMIIADDFNNIYKKEESSTQKEEYLNQSLLSYRPYSSENFSSADIVCKERNSNFKANGFNKYTIVLWLEGCDADCTDDVLQGSIQMRMDFSVIES